MAELEERWDWLVEKSVKVWERRVCRVGWFEREGWDGLEEKGVKVCEKRVK